ncbi:Glutamate receptor ionotropic, kainate 2 [Chionoecetes opilio]|uniref:Glutamate receptor ionotropic, kainate 2 n=1 Tax=Chionoecetes opilio TaxID=41210 RepID=A0A8J5CF68_CHIOP|nr:Glutamate receptor ionotropic, kainate 2 [Chionoecetes opilio]
MHTPQGSIDAHRGWHVVFFTLHYMISSSPPTIAASSPWSAWSRHHVGRGPGKQTRINTSKLPVYQRMFSFMESQNPTVYTKSNEEGVKRVQKGDGMYAYMMESSSIEYITERYCDLSQVGGPLDSKSYGIALPPGSSYRTLINAAVLRLQEGGVLHELKRRWWKEKRGGGTCQMPAAAEGKILK